jgi:arylsulfatase A-like enzyme
MISSQRFRGFAGPGGLRGASILVIGLAACGSDKDLASGGKPPPVESAPPPTATVAVATSAAVPTATASAAAVAAPAVPKDANILVISIDALRADRLLSHGYSRDVMPNINAFEKTAVSYSDFHSVSSYTSQSLAGFLAGRFPSELKRNGSFFNIYPPGQGFFPEDLQKGGVHTMSGQAHWYFGKDEDDPKRRSRSGFDSGFDVWDIVPGLKKNNKTDESITSPQSTEIALRELGDEANTKGRFFAWYHMLDPHDAYQAHPDVKEFGKSSQDRYDGEIYFTDTYVKKILDFVDSKEWGKRTYVFITADHGEAFGKHGVSFHGFELYEVLTRVPMMVRGPGLKPRVIDAPRGAVDLAPTFLDIYGLPADPAFDGKSLLPELLGGDAPQRDVISDLARTTDNDRRRTLQRGDWKIIELGDADGYQLFNLKDDPDEEHDVSHKETEKLAELKKALQDAAKSIKEICPSRTDHLHQKKKSKPC